ncbi:MAG: hypothetical protein RMI34_09935, partial [Chloroherpetonaceae bacterium]|nr:hypothetical protein [Chloroherpetonaceae bacterium]
MFCLFSLFPIIEVFKISLRPSNNLFSSKLELIPEGATFQNYVDIFTKHPFLKWAFNSMLVSLVVTLVSVGLASTAGYAFSRY